MWQLLGLRHKTEKLENWKAPENKKMSGQDMCQRDQLDHSDQAIRVNMKKKGKENESVVVNMHGMISI